MTETTNDEILTTWFEYQGDLQAVIDKHKLTAAQIRDFAADPIVRKTLDDYEALLARRQRIHAMSHQHNAAEMLSKSMFETASTIECRRAATALARLTRDMLRKNSSPDRGEGGGGGGGGRVCGCDAGGGVSEPGAKSDPLRSDVPPQPHSTPNSIEISSNPTRAIKAVPASISLIPLDPDVASGVGVGPPLLQTPDP